MNDGRFTVSRALQSLLLIAAIVAASAMAIRPLAVAPAYPEAQSGDFSLERALADLDVITAEPRFPGSAGHAAAVDYLVAEFDAMGLDPEVTNTLSVSTGENGANVGRARNVLARIEGSASTGAILLAGHLDSVHTTNGASDCGGCSIAVLETARALLDGPPLRNDVVLLMEDGEETTRAGSLSFVNEHRWAEDVRVAFNLEAMGTRGASLLYVTGPGNGWLVREALSGMPTPVAYSFANDLVWLTGTGGSDLDQFLMAADVGLGLVYLDNVPAYHAMTDNVAHLDPNTLGHQGSTMLALARHFGDLSLDGDLQTEDAVYFNTVGHQVVRYSPGVGVALALLAAIGTVGLIVIGFRRRRLSGRGVLIGAVSFVPFMFAATAFVGLVWHLIRLLDPRLQVFIIGVSYDRPWYTLAFVLLAMGIAAAGYRLLRRRPSLELSVGALLWAVILATWSAFQLPGSSYLFSLSALLVLLIAAVRLFSPSPSGWPSTIVTALGSAGVVLLMAPAINFLGIFSGRAEVLMGLPVIAMLLAPFVALLVGLLLPAWEQISGGRRGLASVSLIGTAALILVGVALTADFTEDRPKPNMIAYVMDADADQAHWVTGAAAVGDQRGSLLDEWTSQFLGDAPEETFYSPWGAPMPATVPAYRSPAPAIDLAVPSAEVLEDRTDEAGRRHLRLRIASARNAPTMVAQFSTDGAFVRSTIVGKPLGRVSADAPKSRLFATIQAAAGDGLEVGLTLRDASSVTVELEDRSYSLPEIDGMAIEPRQSWMMPSPTFVSDATIVRRTVTIP